MSHVAQLGSYAVEIPKNRSSLEFVDIDRLANSPVGNLIQISGTDGATGEQYDHYAFVPHDLGDIPTLSAETWTAVGDAREAIARLDQVLQESGPDGLAGWMSRPLLRKEAKATSAIEGTFAAFEDVLSAEADESSPRSAEVREVLNYVAAAERCFAYAQEDRLITSGLLCELQAMLVEGTRSAERDPGRLRTGQVAVGSPTRRVEDARFVPMPPGPMLAGGVDALIDWLGVATDSSRDPIVEVALAHYQFESLHPFADGNGRIGRMMIVSRLVSRRALSLAVLTISPELERHAEEYWHRLYEVSADGNWDGWIRFLANSLVVSARDVIERIGAVQSIADNMKSDLQQFATRTGNLAYQLPPLLTRSPIVTVARVAEELECTPTTATNAINRLVGLGHLTEVTGGSYARKYAAVAMLNALTKS